MKSILILIKKNTKELLSINYFLSIIIMLSLAWLFNTPALNHAGYNNSRLIIKSYDFVLIYFITINMLLHIGNHLKEELKSGRINLLRNKYSDVMVLCLYVCSYFFFFLVFNIIPAYTTALLQQWINSPGNVALNVFLIDSISGLFSYGLIWILLTVYLVLYWFSETKIVLLLYAIIILMSLVNIYSRFNLFNMNWLYGIYSDGTGFFTIISITMWLLLVGMFVVLLTRTAKDISHKLIPKPYHTELFTRIFKYLKLDMSKYHLSMMGLEAQKILMLFTTAGAVVLFSLLKIRGADFLVLSKIYLGVIVPITFSFNQQQIIDVDKDAGTLNSVLLRDISYDRIILNRWLLIILPQIVIVTFYFVAFFYNTVLFNTVFYLYLVALNILCSFINLNLHLLTGKSGVAKIFVLLSFYIPLRADIQRIFNSDNLLSAINVFDSLTKTGNIGPSIYQQSALASFILVLFAVTVKILRSRNYAMDY